MIFKDKDVIKTNDPKQFSGQLQESDVAFYLRRAYKDRSNVHVLNDLKIQIDGETAQIDHLICYSYGFIIVESKSIKGRVRINPEGEWSRSYKHEWFGIKSPIKQALMQMAILKEFLKRNSDEMFGAAIFGLNKASHREYDVLCAISPDVIIERKNSPKDVLSLVVKNESLVEMLDKKMNIPKTKIGALLKISDSRPKTSDEVLARICHFFIEHDKLVREGTADGKVQGVSASSQERTEATLRTEPTINLSGLPENGATISEAQYAIKPCKHCTRPLTGGEIPGRHGAYYKCTCGKNTPASFFETANAELEQPQAQVELPIQGNAKHKCKHCSNTEGLKFARGKHGPFMNCPSCNKNTAYKDAVIN